eukprot:363989-Chlamydomonas_euryale.AAC.3
MSTDATYNEPKEASADADDDASLPKSTVETREHTEQDSRGGAASAGALSAKPIGCSRAAAMLLTLDAS